MIKRWLVLLILITGSAFYHEANAACNSRCTCTLTVNNITFGNFNPMLGSPLSSSYALSVACTTNTGTQTISYTVQFSAGNSGNRLARYMKGAASASNHLTYNIYKDASFTQILGNNAGGTTQFSNTFSLAVGAGTRTDNYVIYGQIPTQGMAIVDSYTDTLTVTLTY